jgi:hypothetical protein
MSIKSIKVAGVTALVLLLLFCALGPANWQYRTGLGWRIDHVVGYFGFTVMFWLAWPERPFMVGGTLMGTAMLLEALQALTPDRHCDFQAALYGVAGALTGTMCAGLLTRLRRLNGGTLWLPQRFGPRWPTWNNARTVQALPLLVTAVFLSAVTLCSGQALAYGGGFGKSGMNSPYSQERSSSCIRQRVCR